MPLLDAHSLTPLHCAWPLNVSIFLLPLIVTSVKSTNVATFPAFPAALFPFIQRSTAGPLSRELQEPQSYLLVVKGVTR